MKNRPVSDLVVPENSHDQIIILQPMATRGMRASGDLGGNGGGDFFEKCNSIIGQLFLPRRFVHVGDLGWARSRLCPGNVCGAPRSFQPCGGIVPISQDNRGNVKFECRGCPTGASSYIRSRELPSLLLHLLLKQMVPDLRMGNYVWSLDLGTIGVAHEVLGVRGANGRLMGSLGFTLMPGMNTLENFGGFDEWLKYLIQAKLDQLEDTQDSLLPELIGPKHKGGQASRLRHWRKEL